MNIKNRLEKLEAADGANDMRVRVVFANQLAEGESTQLASASERVLVVNFVNAPTPAARSSGG